MSQASKFILTLHYQVFCGSNSFERSVSFTWKREERIWTSGLDGKKVGPDLHGMFGANAETLSESLSRQKCLSVSYYLINSVERWLAVATQCYAASLHGREQPLPTPAHSSMSITFHSCMVKHRLSHTPIRVPNTPHIVNTFIQKKNIHIKKYLESQFFSLSRRHPDNRTATTAAVKALQVRKTGLERLK